MEVTLIWSDINHGVTEHGSDAWWAASTGELLPAEVRGRDGVGCVCVWGGGGVQGDPAPQGRREGDQGLHLPVSDPVTTRDVITIACGHHITKMVAKHGSDVWWAASIEELLPAEVSPQGEGGGSQGSGEGTLIEAARASTENRHHTS